MGAFTSSGAPAKAQNRTQAKNRTQAQSRTQVQARKGAAAAPAKASAVDPYREPVLRARVAEAETRAAEAAETAALRQSLAQQMAAARDEAQVDRGRLSEDLATTLAGRRAELQADQGSSRADAAARGIASGATARALLDGLAEDAQGDMAAARDEATRRLEDIRRGLEVKRQENLLALAERRQQARLAVREAHNATTFAARDAWLRQTTDRRKALEQYRQDQADYRQDLAEYRRDLADYNRRLAEQRAGERGKVIDTVTGGVVDLLFRRR